MGAVLEVKGCAFRGTVFYTHLGYSFNFTVVYLGYCFLGVRFISRVRSNTMVLGVQCMRPIGGKKTVAL